MTAPVDRPPRGRVPQAYREILYWKITHRRWLVLVLNVLAFPLAAVFGVALLAFAIPVGRLLEVRSRGTSAELVILLVSLALTPVLHELVHGIAMRAYDARPRFGVLWRSAMFYATAPGFAFTRNQYLLVTLAPLVGLTLLCLLGMALLSGSLAVPVLGLCATVNAGGAVGDLGITLLVTRYPAQAYVIDERDGLRVFMPAGTGAE